MPINRFKPATLSIFFLLILTTCGIIFPNNGCWKTGAVQKDSTYFPDPKLDYNPTGYQARLAMPENEKLINIWIKGDINNIKAQIYNHHNNSITEVIELSPPYYTAKVAIDPEESDSISIKFGTSSDNDLQQSSKERVLSLRKIKAINEIDSVFSFMIYGCFQPFHVGKEGEPMLLHNESNPLNYEMRQLFNDVGMERPIDYYPSGKDSLNNDIMVENPVVLIGTGDQIYVDPGYEASDFSEHAMSAWAHDCKDPYALLDVESYKNHIDRSYRNFYAFKCFEEIQATIPSISVWDDHEIRDGWGSHGDEYSEDTGEMSNYLKPYFNISKSAYITHQLMLDPKSKELADLIEENESLEQVYEIKGIPLFAFDLRSNRNIYKDQAVNEDQLNSFKEWCKELKNGSEVIIISSIPFFYKPHFSLKLLARLLQPALRDDINDGWYSKYNEGQRNQIVNEIISLRNRDIKPIILAGDAHLGVMTSIWYNAPDDQKKRLCYELIYSGLSHESLGEERNGFKISLQKRPEGNEKNDPTFPVGDYQIHYIHEYLQGRLNFGALEFNLTKPTTASLFIVGDEEEYFTKQKMELNWEETFEEYLDRAESIDKYTYKPPVLSLDKIQRSTDK
ncbi:MAG: hypothetical protein ACNS60_00505 [Candidatus Cyclobacteriaceae bacterium M2_1C_046]